MNPKIFFSICVFLCAWPLLARTTINSDEEVERDYHPQYLNQAFGSLSSIQGQHRQRTRHPWPVKVKSIGHTMASYQRYGGLDEAYFHHGLDIRADAGSEVKAAAGGLVINIENYMPGNDAYWEIAILDNEGFIWQYHHIERDSIPEAIFAAYKNKTPISEGSRLGEVYFWSVVTFGERYHHIHLNVLDKNKSYLNPFEFLELLPDTKAPEISHFYLVKQGEAIEGNSILGSSYTIGAEIQDLILSNVFIVPPNEIKVSIDGEKSFTVWKFDSLPGGSSNEKFVNQFYIPNLACGDYSCRKPVIDLGFRKMSEQVFPTNPGKHSIEVWVSDYNGNVARRSFDWIVE
jgi:hypothetical protein